MNKLHTKYPAASPCSMIFLGPTSLVNEVIYDSIDESEILKACLRTKGAAGVSGSDDKEWWIIFGSKIFGNAAAELRRSITRLTRIMCINCIVEPKSLEVLLVYRVMPLDKNPRLRPIGIGEGIRRITGKAVTSCLESDIINTNGNLQLRNEIR